MGNSEETDQILTTCLLEISCNLVIRNKFKTMEVENNGEYLVSIYRSVI